MAQQIKNLAETKTLPPINGLVRWTFNPHYEAKDFVFNTQVFTIDPMLKGFRAPIPEGIEGKFEPFDHLALFAFNDSLQISQAQRALKEFHKLLADQLEISIANSKRDGAPSKTELSEAEQKPFCVVMEGRQPI